MAINLNQIVQTSFQGYSGYSGYSGANPNVIISDTAPTSPVNGTMWWDSTTGTLKMYYQDADSSQWVDANQTSLPSGLPSGALVGTTDTQTLSNKTLVFSDGTTQTTAGASTGKAIAMAIVFGG